MSTSGNRPGASPRKRIANTLAGALALVCCFLLSGNSVRTGGPLSSQGDALSAGNGMRLVSTIGQSIGRVPLHPAGKGDVTGGGPQLQPDADQKKPDWVGLGHTHPNPFNPSTTVDFVVDEQTHVLIRVYDIRGTLVRTLVDGTKEPGRVHSVSWDGTDSDGQPVASGVYFYRLVTSHLQQTRKVVLLK